MIGSELCAICRDNTKSNACLASPTWLPNPAFGSFGRRRFRLHKHYKLTKQGVLKGSWNLIHPSINEKHFISLQEINKSIHYPSLAQRLSFVFFNLVWLSNLEKNVWITTNVYRMSIHSKKVLIWNPYQISKIKRMQTILF